MIKFIVNEVHLLSINSFYEFKKSTSPFVGTGKHDIFIIAPGVKRSLPRQIDSDRSDDIYLKKLYSFLLTSRDFYDVEKLHDFDLDVTISGQPFFNNKKPE